MMIPILNKKLHRKALFMEAIGLVLGIALLILTFIFIGRLILGHMSGQDESSTIASFNALGDSVDSLSRFPGYFASKESMPIFVGSAFMIVGFDKDRDSSPLVCYHPGGSLVATEYFIKKPSTCGTNACLCLFQADLTDFGQSNMITTAPQKANCRVFPFVDYFATLNYRYVGKDGIGSISDGEPYEKFYQNYLGSPKGPGYPYMNIQDYPVPAGEDYNAENSGPYNDLFIYGECDDWWGDKAVGIHNIYIEKISVKDKEKTTNIIFIAPVFNLTEERKDYVDKLYTASFEKIKEEYKGGSGDPIYYGSYADRFIKKAEKDGASKDVPEAMYILAQSYHKVYSQLKEFEEAQSLDEADIQRLGDIANYINFEIVGTQKFAVPIIGKMSAKALELAKARYTEVARKFPNSGDPAANAKTHLESLNQPASS